MREIPSLVNRAPNPWPMRLRIFAIPLLLSLVAGVHIAEWALFDRSSWGSGCSFGMFCTVDYHDSRFIKCYAEIDGVQHPLALEDQMPTESLNIRVMPSEKNLICFCQELAKRVDQDGDEVNVAPTAASVRHDLDGVRVEIWGLEMNGPRQRLTSHLVNSLSWRNPTSRWNDSSCAKGEALCGKP